jgi:peptidyl-prolyl cis-trans isomerase D
LRRARGLNYTDDAARDPERDLMLSAIRAFAKSWIATLLIGLLIVSFAVFGIRDVFHARVSNAVVVAGSRTVSANDFRREFDAVRKRAEQQYGQPVTPEMAAANGLDRQVLQGLATREALAELLHRAGVRPSDNLIGAQIGKIPAFFNPVTGKFDKQQYLQRLAQNELTAPKFEAALRDEMAGQHFVSALMNNFMVPRAYSAMAAVFALESRDVSYLSVEPGAVPAPPAPTDQQLTTFMNENASQLTLPEFRVLTVARFSPQQFANLPVNEAEVRKRYEFRKDTLSTPETRSLVQIPAKDAATAQAITARLQKGEAAAAVAKSVGVDAITYENKPQSAIPDRKLAAGAFQLQPGEVGAVQGDLGLAVIKVTSATPGKAVSFEEARPAIEAELRKDAAGDKVYALTQAYDDAHQKGANLAEAAQKAGVTPITLGPVSRDGRDQQGQPLQGLPQKLTDAAFGLPAGGESEVTDAGNGEYFAVRVDKIIPPAMPSLASIRPQLAQAWTMRQLVQSLQAKADSLAARVRKGESLEAVGASAGVRLVHAPGVDRRTGEQNPLMSQEILGNAFGAKPGDVFVARGRNAIVVGRVDAIHSGDPATLAGMTEQARPQMTATVFREVGESAQAAARRAVKVRIDYNRAREAIGLQPLDAKGKPEPAK